MEQLDCRGLKCPMPLVRISQRMREMEDGDLLEVLADDMAFCPDIEAWSEETGNTLVQCEGSEGQWTVVVRKESGAS